MIKHTITPSAILLPTYATILYIATHNIPVQEYPPDDDSGIKAELVKEPLKRDGGYLLIPTAPGIGIELNEEAFRHYPPVPYERPALINPDGSLREY
ncbi:TPA: hypothetical protein EYO57_02315 [Candidatus Poribacteria bacterium]|nr:hypothetical protein [Candidatus Poribacteria bacterium]